MSWFNIFKPQKKTKPLKLTKWEEVYYVVDSAKDMQTKTIEVECSVSTMINECQRWVFYLEDCHNAAANALFSKYYKNIAKRFEREGYTFIYAPKEAEKIAEYYGMPMPDVEWNAATLLDMLLCQCNEPIGSVLAMIDIPSDDKPYTARLLCISLDADNEEGIIAILKALWKSLNDSNSGIRFHASEDECCYEARGEERCCMSGNFFTDDGESAQAKRDEELSLERQSKIREIEERKISCQPPKRRGGYLSGFERKMKEVSDDVETYVNDFLIEIEDEHSETLTLEDEQLLNEIKIRVEKLRQRGIRQHLIEQFVRMTVPTSHLEVTPDARILLTDYNKEVQMLPIDKVVYILYLRHPEGISIKNLADHKEELMGLYARVLGKAELTDKQKASVERLCDPWDNSINEKLSRIRKSFCAEVHESVADKYVIQGERGAPRIITLDEEFIELGDWGR